MKKKIFGIRLSTYLTVALCLVAAFILWLYVNFPGESSNVTSLISDLIVSL